LIGLDIRKRDGLLSRKNARIRCVTKHTDRARGEEHEPEIAAGIFVLPSSTAGEKKPPRNADFPTPELNSRRTAIRRKYEQVVAPSGVLE
jgi:hypothetical protein